MGMVASGSRRVPLKSLGKWVRTLDAQEFIQLEDAYCDKRISANDYTGFNESWAAN